MSFAGSLAGAVLLGVVAGWTGASTANPAAYRTVMWVTPLAFAACAGAMLAAMPAPRVASSLTIWGARRLPFGVFVLLGIVVFLFTAGEGTLRAFFNVYLDTGLHIAPAQIGLTMGTAQLLTVAASLAVPCLLARFGTAGTLTLASLVAAAGLVALGAVPLLPVAGAAYMAAMSMIAVHGATRNVFSQQLVGTPWRTTTVAILTVGIGTGLGQFRRHWRPASDRYRLQWSVLSDQYPRSSRGDRHLGVSALRPGRRGGGRDLRRGAKVAAGLNHPRRSDQHRRSVALTSATPGRCGPCR
jgi:hypothetical protein